MPAIVSINQGWQFHMGELAGADRVKKITNKAGMCGGASNLTREEGIFIPQPGIFTHMTGREDSIYGIMGISERLVGDWALVDLPHDWMFRQPYQNQADEIKPTDVLESVIVNPGYFKHGAAYYRKVFARPDMDEHTRVRLEFDGVMHNSGVWINGHYLGGHMSGYAGFSFDITEYLNDKNALLVRTDSNGNEGWWYEGAGIYRDARLVAHNEVSLKGGGFWAQMGEITNKSAQGRIFTEIENASAENAEVMVYCEITQPDGKSVCKLNGKLFIPAFSVSALELPFAIENPILWDLDTPVLYSAKADISCHSKLLDSEVINFGIRQMEYKRQGLFLNGRLTEIKGVCQHQDFAGVGTALTEDIMFYKVRRFKEMGANAIRSSHHLMTKPLLDICDREGMLVLNENRNFSVNPEALEDLSQMVRDSRNHPCVFMYCLENEEFITHTAVGRALLRRMKSLVNSLDPTRPVTTAGQIAKGDPEYVRIADVAGFNYDGGDAAVHLSNMPALRVMATEDSNIVSTRGSYEDSRVKCQCTCRNEGMYTSDEMDAGTFGGAASAGTLENAWNHYKNQVPELGGVFIWTGMDYRGESFPWYWPSVTSQYGAMDICGFAKDSYYYWQSVWLDKPVIHVLPHWDWPGMEGTPIVAESYSNCEETELFVNGVSQGRVKSKRGEITRWYVIYQPGDLKVIGYNGNIPAAEHNRVTFGEAAEVRLELVFSGERLTLVRAAAYDAAGNFCETASTELSFEIANGEIIGCGNGDPASHEDDTKPYRRLFNGLALIIVKPFEKESALTARYSIGGVTKSAEIRLPLQ